jgi:hypothetical protein
VDIVMAVSALLIDTAESGRPSEAGRKLCVYRRVALGTREGGVHPFKKLAGRLMGIVREPECLAPVTRMTAIAELAEVNILVAGLTGAVDPLESNRAALRGREHAGLSLVTFHALDRGMFAGE